MKSLTLTPNVIRRDPTFQEVKDHMEKKGLRPLRQEEVEKKDPMLIFLGGSRPMWHRGGLDWDQIAFTTGFIIPSSSMVFGEFRLKFSFLSNS